MLHYNKLIRDKMPEVARKQGKQIKVRNATTDQEYWYLLKNKLQEEVNELGENSDMESIIDIIDVVEAIMKFKKYDRRMLDAVRENKAIEYGKFNDRMVLEESDQEIGHEQSQLI